jgi:drug/metabolite transporter (DMT)-like permease
MAYLPVLLGALTAFCWGTSDYLSRSSSQKAGHYRTTVYMHVFSTATLFLLLPILRPDFGIPFELLLTLIAVSAVNFFAFIFLYRGFHHGVVSVVAPIAYSYPIVTTIFAVIFLGVMLSGLRTLAIGAVILGVILLSTRFSELNRYLRGGGLVKVMPGVDSAVVAAVSFGSVYVVIGFVTPLVGYVLPVLFLRGLGAIFGFALAPLLKQDVRPGRDVLTWTIFVMGILETVGLLSFNLGISFGSGTLPVVTALSGMGGAFATTYAMAFLRERLEPNQLAGILLSIAGVLALLYLTS